MRVAVAATANPMSGLGNSLQLRLHPRLYFEEIPMPDFTVLKRFISSLAPVDQYILLVTSVMFLVGVCLIVGEAHKWRKERAKWHYHSFQAARRRKKAA